MAKGADLILRSTRSISRVTTCATGVRNMSLMCPYTYLGAIMFVSVPAVLLSRRNTSSSSLKQITTRGTNVDAIGELVASMEQLVQKDEGKRGIAEILLPSGELLEAANAMVNAKRVAIITGFPCMLQHTPPTETDGPLGALALSKCLIAMGKDVVLATDECNEDVLLACTRASTSFAQTLPGIPRAGKLTLESFAPAAVSDEKEEQRMQELAASVDLVIAIERSGPCMDGGYRTMRGYDMTHLVAPLEMLLMPPGVMEAVETTEGSAGSGAVATSHSKQEKAPRSIGIGDGGNEVGMGKIYERVVRSAITNAAQIACVVPTDHLLVCSVSNWGGYALSAAAAVVHAQQLQTQQSAAEPLSREQLLRHLAVCLPSEAEETSKCQNIVAAGARDGVTGKLDLYVDGMPLATSLEVLRKLRELDL